MKPTATKNSLSPNPLKKELYEVRESPVHGTGVFAAQKIKKGERILQYTGERISAKEGDQRYNDEISDRAFVLLFTVSKNTVLDGAVGGSDAKYINHSCDPNCEAVLDKKRVYIEAVRDIEADEELNYDYAFERDKGDDGSRDALYACHCGSSKCRGTMLVAAKKPNSKEALKKMKKDFRKEMKKDLKKLKKDLQKDAKKKLAKAKKELKKAAKKQTKASKKKKK